MPSWGVKTSSEASQPSDGPTRRVEVTHERSRGRSSSRDRGRKRHSEGGHSSGSRRKRADREETPKSMQEDDDDALNDMLSPFLDEPKQMRRICNDFLTRVYSVFKPDHLTQIESLLDKYSTSYLNLVLGVKNKYLLGTSSLGMIEDIITKLNEEKKKTPDADAFEDLKSQVTILARSVKELTEARGSRDPLPEQRPRTRLRLSLLLKEIQHLQEKPRR